MAASDDRGGRDEHDPGVTRRGGVAGDADTLPGPRPGEAEDELTDADEDADDPLFAGLLREVARAPVIDALPVDDVGLRPGTIVDGCFRIVRVLGRGGMGVVYLADHLQLERKVALKLHSAAAGSEGTSRLLREARAMASVVHDDVITVYDVGTVGGQVYIAMEHVDGGTLRDWLARAPRSCAEIVAVFVAAGRGLAAAHGAGLVHRDFKPDNVLVGLDGRVRVADFGLARAAEGEGGVRLRWREEATSLASSSGSTPRTEPGSGASEPSSRAMEAGLRLTATGALVGTPAYMAPEQHAGRPADARSDQFAFCVSLYEALYGARPFRGKNLVELVTSMTDGSPALPPRAREVPPHVRRVLRRGLERDPAARFADMAALLRELERDPAAARRRWLGIGAAVVLTAAGVGVAQQVARQDPCTGGDERMAPVWGPSQGEALERALARDGGSMGAVVGPRVRARLDAQAAAWVAGYREACEATRLREVQSEDALDLRMACLDARREELAALVEVLAAGDPEVAARADQASLSLSPVDRCADLEALRRVERIAAADREPAEVVRRGLARAKGTLDTGRYAEGLALGEEALARARALGYASLEAEAQAWVADARIKLDEPEAAVRAYEGALTSAIASGDDQTALRALLGLVYVEGYRLERFEPGERWLRQVDAWLQRVGDAGPMLVRRYLDEALMRREQGRLRESVQALGRGREAADALPAGEHAQDARLQLTGALAVTLREQGDLEGALAAHAEAIALAEALYGPRHPSLATELNNAAAARIQQGDLEGSEQLLRRALEIREASFGPTHRSVLEGQINLAIVELQRGHVDAAAARLEPAERNAGGAEPEIRVELQTMLGGIRIEQGRLEEAEAALRRGLDEASATWPADEPRRLRLLTNLANLTNRRLHHAEAERLAREGLRAVEGSTRESLGLIEGYLWLNLGDALLEQGRHAEARPAFAAGLERMEANLGASHPHLSSPLWGLGECALEADEPAEAEPLLVRALALAEGGDASTRGRIRFALARVRWRSGEHAQARALAEAALADLEGSAAASRERVAGWLRTHAP